MAAGQPFTQVDAFADQPFAGNPAGVCVLPAAREAAWMQLVAREMHLAATAFLVPRPDGYDLRWFTPACEVDLCGHATLASAHVLWDEGRLSDHAPARFHTRSGVLTAERSDGLIWLDLPATPAAAAPLLWSWSAGSAYRSDSWGRRGSTISWSWSPMPPCVGSSPT